MNWEEMIPLRWWVIPNQDVFVTQPFQAESLTRKLEYLMETNQHLKEQIDEMESEGNYEEIMNEVKSQKEKCKWDNL